MDSTSSLPRLFYKTIYKTVLTEIIRVAFLQISCCISTKYVKISLFFKKSGGILPQRL